MSKENHLIYGSWNQLLWTGGEEWHCLTVWNSLRNWFGSIIRVRILRIMAIESSIWKNLKSVIRRKTKKTKNRNKRKREVQGKSNKWSHKRYRKRKYKRKRNRKKSHKSKTNRAKVFPWTKQKHKIWESNSPQSVPVYRQTTPWG